jgi:hypothetical protein
MEDGRRDRVTEGAEGDGGELVSEKELWALVAGSTAEGWFTSPTGLMIGRSPPKK